MLAFIRLLSCTDPCYIPVLVHNFLLSTHTVTHMAGKPTSNLSCFDAVMTTYHACVNEVAMRATPSRAWPYSSTTVGVVTIATCVVVAAMLFTCVQAASKSSVRHELFETLEVIVCLFTAQLSFATLIMNSIWMFGQVLASLCDLLTLSPR